MNIKENRTAYPQTGTSWQRDFADVTELKILSLRSYSGWTQQEGGRRVRVTGDVEVKAEIVCV